MAGKRLSSRAIVDELIDRLLNGEPYESALPGAIDGVEQHGSKLIALLGEIGQLFDVRHKSWQWRRGRVVTVAGFYPRPHAKESMRIAGEKIRRAGGAVWMWHVADGQITRLDMHARSLPAPGRHLAQILVDVFYCFGASIVAVALFAILVNTPQAREVLLLAAGVPGSKISYSLLLDTIGWTLAPASMIVYHGILAAIRTAEHPVLPGRVAGRRLWWPPVSVAAVAWPLLIAAFVPGAVAVALARASFATRQPGIVAHLRLWSGVPGCYGTMEEPKLSGRDPTSIQAAQARCSPSLRLVHLATGGSRDSAAAAAGRKRRRLRGDDCRPHLPIEQRWALNRHTPRLENPARQQGVLGAAV